MSAAQSMQPPIDFRRYPLADDGSATMAALAEQSRRQLDERQYCSLPGFLSTDATAGMVDEAKALLGRANPAESWRNCYLQREKSETYAPHHPRNLLNHASYRMIAADCFPPDGIWSNGRGLIAFTTCSCRHAGSTETAARAG